MHKIRLFLELRSAPTTDEAIANCALADGLALAAAVDPATVPCAPHGMLLLCGHEPAAAIEGGGGHEVALVPDTGLDKLARRRDGWPQLNWIPRARVYRAPARFDFQTEYHGEGFKMYMPNLTTYRTYRVAREELELRVWLDRARELGFSRIWLAGMDAEDAGNGLDLEMLDAARRHYSDTIWMSGGATSPAHLRNLAREGSADAVVLPLQFAASEGMGALRTALAPALPVTVAGADGPAACGVVKPCA